MTDDLALMRIHIEALYRHDADGRMVRVNDPAAKPAPRFFLGRTAHGKLWRVRHDLDSMLVRELAAACAAEPAGEFLEPPYGAPPYETLLARAAPVERVWAGPVYRFEGLPRRTSGTFAVTPGNVEVLRRHFPDWLGDVTDCQPFVAVEEDGHAVSVCASVRITPEAHEAGVDTHRDFRGRGYAGRAVAAWARAVRALGAIPLYSTSWQNAASQAVARKLGLVRLGADLHIT